MNILPAELQYQILNYLKIDDIILLATSERYDKLIKYYLFEYLEMSDILELLSKFRTKKCPNCGYTPGEWRKSRKTYKVDSYISKNELSIWKRHYPISNNGGIDLKMVANNKGIHIFEYIDNRREGHKCKKLYTIEKFEGYWYGSDKTKYYGNTILIQITKKKYMYINGYVYSFETDREISEYFTSFVHDDVPYNIAEDGHYIYFLTYKKMIYLDDFLNFIDKSGCSDGRKNIYNIYSNLPDHIKYDMKYDKK